jgi:endonuclease-3
MAKIAPSATHAQAVHERLRRAIPRPRIELEFEDPWQLLVATILSARSTDRVVNRVTPVLFQRYPSAKALARANLADLEAIVRPTGFFRAKAKTIREASRDIVERFSGCVPSTMDELVRLAGVARKTANVVLAWGFGNAAGFVVDTHVARVAHRLGLTREADPVRIERDLCAAFPRRLWISDSMRLLLHGRYVCTARAPRCGRCPLNEVCPSREADPVGTWLVRADGERRLVEGHRTLAP